MGRARLDDAKRFQRSFMQQEEDILANPEVSLYAIMKI